MFSSGFAEKVINLRQHQLDIYLLSSGKHHQLSPPEHMSPEHVSLMPPVGYKYYCLCSFFFNHKEQSQPFILTPLLKTLQEFHLVEPHSTAISKDACNLPANMGCLHSTLKGTTGTGTATCTTRV